MYTSFHLLLLITSVPPATSTFPSISTPCWRVPISITGFLPVFFSCVDMCRQCGVHVVYAHPCALAVPCVLDWCSGHCRCWLEQNIGCLSPLLFHLFLLELGSLTDMELAAVCEPGWLPGLWSTLWDGVTDICGHTQLFTQVLEIWVGAVSVQEHLTAKHLSSSLLPISKKQMKEEITPLIVRLPSLCKALLSQAHQECQTFWYREIPYHLQISGLRTPKNISGKDHHNVLSEFMILCSTAFLVTHGLQACDMSFHMFPP